MGGFHRIKNFGVRASCELYISSYFLNSSVHSMLPEMKVNFTNFVLCFLPVKCPVHLMLPFDQTVGTVQDGFLHLFFPLSDSQLATN